MYDTVVRSALTFFIVNWTQTVTKDDSVDEGGYPEEWYKEKCTAMNYTNNELQSLQLKAYMVQGIKAGLLRWLERVQKMPGSRVGSPSNSWEEDVEEDQIWLGDHG